MSVIDGALEHGGVLVDLQRVRLAAVVESRLERASNSQLTAGRRDGMRTIGGGRSATPGLSIGMKSMTSATPFGDMKRVMSTAVSGKYSCLRDVLGVDGVQCEATALLVVEQRREDARRIEPRAAEPVDGAVGGDERARLLIADQSVIGDRRVVVGIAWLPGAAGCTRLWGSDGCRTAWSIRAANHPRGMTTRGPYRRAESTRRLGPKLPDEGSAA